MLFDIIILAKYKDGHNAGTVGALSSREIFSSLSLLTAHIENNSRLVYIVTMY